jgi:hypothetical protein
MNILNIEHLDNLYQNNHSDNILFSFTKSNTREIGNYFKFKNNKYIIVTNYEKSGGNNVYIENNVYLNILRVTNDLQYVLFNKIINRPLEDPYIFVNGDTVYLYCEDKYDVPFKNICVYTSTDLQTFNRIGNVITPSINVYENKDVSSPAIIKKGDTFWMLYEGRSDKCGGCICLAYSKDLIEWSKYENNPIIVGKLNSDILKNVQTNVFYIFDSIVPDDIVFYDNKYIASFHVYKYGITKWMSVILYSDDLFKWNLYNDYMKIENCDYGQGVMFFNKSFYYIDTSQTNIRLLDNSYYINQKNSFIEKNLNATINKNIVSINFGSILHYIDKLSLQIVNKTNDITYPNSALSFSIKIDDSETLYFGEGGSTKSYYISCYNRYTNVKRIIASIPHKNPYVIDTFYTWKFNFILKDKVITYIELYIDNSLLQTIDIYKYNLQLLSSNDFIITVGNSYGWTMNSHLQKCTLSW